MPSLRGVWTLYRMELRSALRDRMIVTNSLLVPVLLYPLLLWLVFLGISFAMGQAGSLTSRVAVRDWPAGHTDLRRTLDEVPKLQLANHASQDAAIQSITQGTLDALVEFTPAQGSAAALPGNFSMRIVFDASKERSATARERLTQALNRYRDTWLTREAGTRDLGGSAWQVFALADRNVASKKQMGSFLLSLLLPVIFAIMVMNGCFYPAVDATAGERERGTWETLMAAPVARSAAVVAKYLYVVTFGLVAGLINFTSMVVTLKPVLAPLLAQAGESLDFTLRPAAVPLVVLGGLLLAAFAAAGMLLLASFAKTFKDGQSQITPFYMLAFLPMLFMQGPGAQLDWRTALVPVANVMLMVRGAITGSLAWPAVALAVASSLVFVAILLALSVFVLHFEDVVVGSYQGNLIKLLRARLGRTRPGATDTRNRHE